MSWDSQFPNPIPVPGRRPLVTLRDAGRYVASLRKPTHDETPWQTAMECLMLAADKGGPIEFARFAMERALRPPPPPVYHSASKDPKWRNSYKLVRDR
jgi:hypothetical protein